MNSIFVREGGIEGFFKTSPVTSIIILLNTIMLLVTLVTGGFGSANLISLGALNYQLIDAGEWYRLITAAFLHGSMIHFLSNTIIGLIVLSSGLERIIKSKKFLTIYLSSMVLSSLLVYGIDSFTGSVVPTIGASGAIFGALGSLLFITVFRPDMLPERDIQSIRVIAIINIVFTFLSPGISIGGHVGGLLSGFLISFLLIRRNVFKVLH